jgi:hypothetical protein
MAVETFGVRHIHLLVSEQERSVSISEADWFARTDLPVDQMVGSSEPSVEISP